MPETSKIEFTHKEVVEALLKKQGIHQGIWGIYMEFRLAAINSGPSDEDLMPTAMVPVTKIGIHQVDRINSLSVDASVVNPKSKSKKVAQPQK